MDNRFLATPTNKEFVGLHRAQSSSPHEKLAGVERKEIPLNFGGRNFVAEDFQITTEDIKSISLNKYLADAYEFLSESAPSDLREQALPYIYALNDKTTLYEFLNLPPISVSLPNDGTLLIEWNFNHFIIGLSFEANQEDSGWYIVNDGTVNKMTAWGYLNSQTMQELMEIFMSQVVE